ncbi:alpha/beta hydrolase [Pseudoroseomonas wenyumeiae]|uniref:Acyl-CoA:diacylglycerol acyltransferase n=1 Tax=Teichococcus wenyumeiae TaxID=2478470 RepID=A0A3A9JH24_9PROT|nr:alpha/beta hydrolase-fold protein [Pseudoroseomonas wenyumeiae]RKK02854.1 alpha/beta hydrolase [Pseudoroseomonas wenyumeiae]RMI27034.1 alpha/beta hydrolase [Pseudoroseomonas wenyumeiae]
MRLRRRILLGGLPALALAGAARAGGAGRAPYVPARAEVWDFTARNGRRYRVLVSWPPGEVPEQGWPVLYALDGNAMFPLLTGACRLLADEHQGVIVAIDFPLDDSEPERRDFEYTTPAPEARSRNGGADALLAVIQDELKPVVEEAFRIDPARQALFGHSYGGLFVLHALFIRPETFSTWVAASPSIWRGGAPLLREAEAFIARPSLPDPPPRLLITFGELEGRARVNAGGPGGPGGSRRVMADNARQMAARLDAVAGRFGAIAVQEFEGESHGSVRAAAAGRALPFAFEG